MSRFNEQIVPAKLQPRTNVELADTIERGYSMDGVGGETHRTYISPNLHGRYPWKEGEYRVCPVGAALVYHFKSVYNAWRWVEDNGPFQVIDLAAALLRVDSYLLATISHKNMMGYRRGQIVQWLVHLPDRMNAQVREEYLSSVHLELARQVAWREDIVRQELELQPTPQPIRDIRELRHRNRQPIWYGVV